MKKNKETFTSLFNSFHWTFEPRSVFDDFLDMIIAVLSPNPVTGKSYYEDLYMDRIGRYEKKEEQMALQKLFALLIDEMEERVTDEQKGNDVLGEYFESNLVSKQNRNNQFFTPVPICKFIAESTKSASTNPPPYSILDPACGSGRMLVVTSRVFGPKNGYFGIDIDPTCVKMTAINLFLNGVFNAEVMCANALLPDTFSFSYRLSFLPLRLYRIDNKEDSHLFKKVQLSLQKPRKPSPVRSSSPTPPPDQAGSDDKGQLWLL